MAFCLMIGTHTFQSILDGYDNLTVQCQNCGNFSAKVMKRWQWFTICWVPLIPFSLKPDHDVSCPVCNFHQDVKHRPDVQQQMGTGGGGDVEMQNQGKQHLPTQAQQQPQQYK